MEQIDWWSLLVGFVVGSALFQLHRIAQSLADIATELRDLNTHNARK